MAAEALIVEDAYQRGYADAIADMRKKKEQRRQREQAKNAKTGETTGKGVFTIVEVKAGQGASVGWGRLKSGAGWISLDYATRLA